MEGTLWKKGRLSYEKRHFCVEEDNNGELCLVGRVKTREGKVENKLLLASLERVDVVDEQTYEFLVEGGGMTLNLRVESRSEFAQWVNGLRAVLGMPDVEFTSSWMGTPDGNTFAGGLSEAMPPAHPQPLSHASPPASGGPAPNPPPPAYSVSTAAPPRLQAGSNLLERPPASPGAQPHPSRYPVVGGGGGAAVRAAAGYNSAQPPPPAYAAASLGYQDGVAVAPPTAAPIAAPTAPGCRQGAPPRGAAGWPPSAVAEAAPPAAMSPVPRAAGAAGGAAGAPRRGGAAGGGAAWAEGRAEGRAEEEDEEAQDLEEAAGAEAREEAELEEAWLSEVEPEVLEAARELGIRLEARGEGRHVHGMCTACARHVHGMCTACARHVHGMCTARICARRDAGSALLEHA